MASDVSVAGAEAMPSLASRASSPSKSPSMASLSPMDSSGRPERPASASAAVKSDRAENVSVAVRIRPLSESENAAGDQAVWGVDLHANRILLSEGGRALIKKASAASTDYIFDQVFIGSDNTELYERSVADVIFSVMEGYNGTVFAYGQTSSGKTFTMSGNDNEIGVIPRSVNDVFTYIRETSGQKEFLLRVSYLEIYNETIRDLLAGDSNVEPRIHEDKRRGVYVSPLREEIVTSPKQVLKILRQGESNRHTSKTDYNERSSRSHTIFQMVIESRERVGSVQTSPSLPRTRGSNVSSPSKSKLSVAVRMSTLNLIDLAGSEKAQSQTERRKEGAYINKSLLTLGTVISRLTESGNSHVPFRDSKLTRILQPSLSGNARVAVVCTITPAANSFEESNSTLKFASRVKKVVTKANYNEILDDKALLQRYRNEIEQLREKLSVSAHQTESERDQELSQLAQEKQKWEEEMQEQQVLRTALKERIDHLTKLILTSSSITPKAMTDWHNHASAGSASNALASSSADDIGKLAGSFASSSSLKHGSGASGLGGMHGHAHGHSHLAKENKSVSVDQISGLNADLVSKSKENEHLRHSLELRDRRIAELEQLVHILQKQGASASASGTSVEDNNNSAINDSLRAEVKSLKHLNQEMEIVIEEQEGVIASFERKVALLQLNVATTPASPVSPKLKEMEAERVEDRKTIAELKFQAKNNELAIFEQLEHNAVSTDVAVKELEFELQRQKSVMSDLEERSIEKIANLETELTIAKAQLNSGGGNGSSGSINFGNSINNGQYHHNNNSIIDHSHLQSAPPIPPALISPQQLYTPVDDIFMEQLDEEALNEGNLQIYSHHFDTPRSLSVNQVIQTLPVADAGGTTREIKSSRKSSLQERHLSTSLHLSPPPPPPLPVAAAGAALAGDLIDEYHNNNNNNNNNDNNM